MHIAIDGIDGVGKTTLARELARRTGARFVEKHLHALFDGEDPADIPNYMRITQKVNASKDLVFRAWFYALGNLYLREHYAGQDIVTDRYFASNYSWNGCPGNAYVFEHLIGELGKPEITFLIYVRPEVRAERLRLRNPEDADLRNATRDFSDRMYHRLRDFLDRYDFHYHLIDTSDMDAGQTLEKVCGIIADEFPERFGKLRLGN